MQARRNDSAGLRNLPLLDCGKQDAVAFFLFLPYNVPKHEILSAGKTVIVFSRQCTFVQEADSCYQQRKECFL